ncbi:LADA_0F10242g1_1 [Lachancea dasiensis]|uniref:Crh-like protein n=1 Tax=Lachancea dasiensis TaxID=1072105 RepID=A0A1G4JLU0_9SACH|nr:LADA_0F10242g1_1 [Lachancea dasiensis]
MTLLKKILIAASAATAFADTSVSSATSSGSSCNPLKTTGCSPDTALGSSFMEPFDEESDHFHKLEYATGQINYTDEGMAMTINKRYDNPSLKSDFYLMFGKVEVEFKAASGQGIVSSFYLQSDDLDEIDLEWTGGDTTQFQSNYFSKGNTSTYDRGAFHGVDAPQDKYHNYTIDWAMDKTVWYLDDSAVRTLTNDSSQGYPQSPMYVMMGCWAGGDPDNAAGTIEWAGGETDYTKAPFTMNVKRVIVTDYSSGEQYSYNGQSGTWDSIEAKDGEVYGRYNKAQSEFSALAGGQTLSSSSSASSSTSSSSTSSSSASSSSASSSSASSSSASSSSASSSSASSSSASSSSASSSSTSSASSASQSSGSSSSSSNSASSSSVSSSIAPNSSASTLSGSSPSGSEGATSSSQTTSNIASSTLVTSMTSSTGSSTSHSVSLDQNNAANALHMSLSSLVAIFAFLL